MEEHIISVFVPIPSRLLKRTTAAKAWFGHTWKDIHMISDAHITLHLAKFPKTKNGFDKFVRELQLNHLSAPSILFSGVRIIKNKIDGNQFFFLGIKNTASLYALHKEVLGIMKPYQRGLIRKKDIERLWAGRFSKIEIQYLKTYGYARVLRFFNPHITFGEVAGLSGQEKKEIMATLKKKLGDAQKAHFVPTHLIVGLYGYERGNYAKIIREVQVELKLPSER